MRLGNMLKTKNSKEQYITLLSCYDEYCDKHHTISWLTTYTWFNWSTESLNSLYDSLAILLNISVCCFNLPCMISTVWPSCDWELPCWPIYKNSTKVSKQCIIICGHFFVLLIWFEIWPLSTIRSFLSNRK